MEGVDAEAVWMLSVCLCAHAELLLICFMSCCCAHVLLITDDLFAGVLWPLLWCARLARVQVSGFACCDRGCEIVESVFEL